MKPPATTTTEDTVLRATDPASALETALERRAEFRDMLAVWLLMRQKEGLKYVRFDDPHLATLTRLCVEADEALVQAASAMRPMNQPETATPARPATEEPPKPRYDVQRRCMTRCQADDDGMCYDATVCPQLRDGEPAKSGRHCPLDTQDEGD